MITSAASSTSIETASARSDPSGQLTEGIRIDYVNAPIFVPPSRPQEFRMGPLLNGQFAFFQEFLKHPLQIGSVIPSSRFLERRILEASGAASAESIVELGSGTGGTTRAILNEMPRHARLLSIEINPQLHASVRKISDDRLIAHLGNACELKKILGLYDMDRPDVVISGIPFSTMSHRSGAQVVAAISSLLAPNGRFVAYQVRKRVAELCRPFLGSGQMEVELLNIPPVRVYQWAKNGR
jgi:phosphatidylethanolamine/phosphatidyl-N-methylethanolamine N-methyltransferase